MSTEQHPTSWSMQRIAASLATMPVIFAKFLVRTLWVCCIHHVIISIPTMSHSHPCSAQIRLSQPVSITGCCLLCRWYMSFLRINDIYFFHKYCIVARPPYRFRLIPLSLILCCEVSQGHALSSSPASECICQFPLCFPFYVSVSFLQLSIFGLSYFLLMYITHNYCFHDVHHTQFDIHHT